MNINYDDFITDTELSLEEAIIPSKDVREYHKKIGFELTDFQKCGLISLSYKLSLFRKHKELMKIHDSTDNISLKKDIECYVKDEQNMFENIINNNDNKSAYIIKVAYDDCYEPNGIFMSFIDAYKACSNITEDYYIEKQRIIFPGDEYEQDEDDGVIDNILANIYFTKNGISTMCVYNRESIPFDTNKFFNAYLEIPDPFRRGDIIYNTRYNIICVVSSDPYEERNRRRKNISIPLDNTDMVCNVDIINDNEIIDDKIINNFIFDHEHFDPLDFEYYTLKEFIHRNNIYSSLSLDEKIESFRDEILREISRIYLNTDDVGIESYLNDLVNDYVYLINARKNLKEYNEKGLINNE